MSSVIGCVLLRAEFTPGDCGLLGETLQARSSDVWESRRGHLWNFGTIGLQRPGFGYSVEIVSTKDRDAEFEDLLLEHDVDFDAAPTAMIISSGIRNQQTVAYIEDMTRLLAETFKGIDCGILE